MEPNNPTGVEGLVQALRLCQDQLLVIPISELKPEVRTAVFKDLQDAQTKLFNSFFQLEQTDNQRASRGR